MQVGQLERSRSSLPGFTHRCSRIRNRAGASSKALHCQPPKGVIWRSEMRDALHGQQCVLTAAKTARSIPGCEDFSVAFLKV